MIPYVAFLNFWATLLDFTTGPQDRGSDGRYLTVRLVFIETNSGTLLVHSSVIEGSIVSKCDEKLEIGSTDLFPHRPQPLRQTDALIRPVLHQHGLGPQSHSRLAVFSDYIQTWHDDAPYPFTPMVPALLDDGSYSLVEVVVEHRQCGLAYLQLCPIRHLEDIFHQLRDSFTAHPEELRLAVINEVESVWHKSLGREIDRRR